jgi:hypothetical protein
MSSCRAVRPKGVTLLQEKKDLAYELGKSSGHSVGTWVIDGRTAPEQCQFIIKGYEAGDPEVMDMVPKPLSGVWADERSPSVLMEELGVRADSRFSERLCDMFEDGFTSAYWDEVLRAARYQVA